MDELLKWLVLNKEWVFSGIGVVIVIGIGRVIYKRKQADSSQNIQSGNNSIIYPQEEFAFAMLVRTARWSIYDLEFSVDMNVVERV